MAEAAEQTKEQARAALAIVPLQTQLPDAAAKRGITAEAWHVLKTVLYKGASDEMVCTVIDYCKARKLDVMKKPFHIVLVWDADAKKMVEGVWPAIAETRITAMRTKEYGGISDVRHGQTKERSWGNTKVAFPEWAQYSVFRFVRGEFREFSGPRVYWLEEYAEKNGGAPNRMWARRPFGQLNKCAEAAALRAAFPEETDNMPTADEMEGKTINGNLMEDITPKKDGNAAANEFAKIGQGADPLATTVIDGDGVVVEEGEAVEEVRQEATQESNAGDQAKANNNMIVKVYASADEPERELKSLSNAVYVIRKLIKDAKTPALAKTIFDRNVDVLARVPKETGDTVEAELRKRMENGKTAKAGNGEGAQGALV